MRYVLKAMDGERLQFTARVEKFGLRSSYRGDALVTLLLKHIVRVDTGEPVADHLWFTKGKNWDGVQIGCQVQFDARVGEYEKGYLGYRDDVYAPVERDYRLERPTRVEVITGEMLR